MDRRRALVTAAIVAVAALLAHGASLWGGFVYDDHRFVEQNQALTSLSDPLRFFADPSTASAGEGIEPDVWRPLRTLVFAANHALFGLTAGFWHLASLVLHAANAVLVWLLLLRLLSRDPRTAEGAFPAAKRAAHARANLFAALGAILFAVHPATSEAVAWVSSFGDLLAWTFVLVAFEVLAKPGAGRTVAGAVLVALACLAKESAVVAFLLLPLRDLALPSAARPSRRQTLVRTAVLAAVTAVYFVARRAVLPGSEDLPAFAQIEFPDGGRLAALRGMLASVAWYAKVLLWPTGFPFDRNVHTDPVPDSWGDPAVVLGAAILLSFVLVGIRAARQGDGVVAFGVFGALAAMVPVSNVIVPLKAYAAERFLYPALPCLVLLVAAAGQRLAAVGRPRIRGGIALAGTAAAVVLGLLAWGRAEAWASETSLWKAVMRENPMNPRAHEGLGWVALSEGRVSEAEKRLRTYREFQPFDGKVQAELADAFWRVYLSLAQVPQTDPRWVDLASNRRFALEQTMLACRAAVSAWTRAGLARGRGSIDLLRRTLDLDRKAAIEAGNLLEARQANLMLLSLAEKAGGTRPYGERRMGAILAAMAIDLKAGDPEVKRSDPARALERQRVRAKLLEDVGADPALPDPQVASHVAELLQSLLDERPDDDDVRNWLYRTLVARASGLDRNDPDWRRLMVRAREHLRFLVPRHPERGDLREDLQKLEGLLR